MDEAASSWIQSISDYEDGSYFNSFLFPGFDGHHAQHVPGIKDNRPEPCGVVANWMGGSGPGNGPQQTPAVHGYGTSSGPAWANNNCNNNNNNLQPSTTALADFGHVSLDDADPAAWLQHVYPPNPAPFAPASLSFGPDASARDPSAAPDFGLGSGSFSPGLLGAVPPGTVNNQGVQQYPELFGSADASLSFQGSQPLGESPPSGWLSDAGGPFAPQAVYHPAPASLPGPSSPCAGDQSSGASLADVSDLSDLSAASPGPASDSDRSPSPARGRAAKARARRPGARSRTRLPSGAPRGSSPQTAVVPWAQSPTGAPYTRIQDMDAASKAVLDAVLLQDRDPDRPVQVPYKVIMAKLRLIFAGAEETLRGHYRRLTKSPDERVRKPVWRADDIRLLREAVPRFRRANKKSVNWTAVSKYIHDNGGSYRFGITTCSKMWGKIQAGDGDGDSD